GVVPMDKNSAAIFKEHDKVEHSASRAVASKEVPEIVVEKSKLISVDQKMIEEYKNNLFQKPVSKKMGKKSMTAIKLKGKKITSEKMTFHIYGQNSITSVASTNENTPVTKSRAPASVLEQEVPKETNTPSPYSKEYQNQYKESDKLINDLKKL
ncbi:MAG: hypothetical protein Q7U04_07350, partial [Bacteriovorax sp.]|nr:hypothetical protein [Bacteriovorax sp.]